MEPRERERIGGEYYSAVKAYSDAVGRLIGLTGADFTEAYRQAEAFRTKCDDCRKVFDELEGSKASGESGLQARIRTTIHNRRWSNSI
jgi:hypothetical protein